MSDRVCNATTITVSVLCLAVLGGGGAALSKLAVFPPGDVWFGDPSLLVWVLWVHSSQVNFLACCSVGPCLVHS